MHITPRLALPRLALIATATLLGFAAQAATPAMAPRASASLFTPVAATPSVTMASRVEARIADLRSRLKIGPAQEPSWTAFTDAMRHNAARMDDDYQDRARTLSTMTANDSMASYARMASRHAEDMQTMSTTFQALYATLNEGQRHTADMMFRTDSNPSARARHG